MCWENECNIGIEAMFSTRFCLRAGYRQVAFRIRANRFQGQLANPYRYICRE